MLVGRVFSDSQFMVEHAHRVAPNENSATTPTRTAVPAQAMAGTSEGTAVIHPPEQPWDRWWEWKGSLRSHMLGNG